MTLCLPMPEAPVQPIAGFPRIAEQALGKEPVREHGKRHHTKVFARRLFGYVLEYDLAHGFGLVRRIEPADAFCIRPLSKKRHGLAFLDTCPLHHGIQRQMSELFLDVAIVRHKERRVFLVVEVDDHGWAEILLVFNHEHLPPLSHADILPDIWCPANTDGAAYRSCDSTTRR